MIPQTILLYSNPLLVVTASWVIKLGLKLCNVMHLLFLGGGRQSCIPDGLAVTFYFLLFETGFLCVTALAVLELALLDQAGLELRDPPASTGIKGLRTAPAQRP